MPHAFSDEALVLKAYDIGEADRLCILLCRENGKMAARAHGVRKLKSRKGGSVLPLQRISAQIRSGSSGHVIVSAHSLDAHRACRNDIQSFVFAVRGMQLLLAFLEDGEPVPDAYDLAAAFLTSCEEHPRPVTLSVFTLRLLDVLGMLPSMKHSAVSHLAFVDGNKVVYSGQHGGLCVQEEDPAGMAIAPELHRFLCNVSSVPCLPPFLLSSTQEQELSVLIQSLLGNQSGSVFSPVNFASSSWVTPI